MEHRHIHITLEGTVSHGNGLGKGLGYPTANICLPDESPLENGVYAAKVTLTTGHLYNAMVSIGSRPTITDNPQRVLEAYLIDFSDDLYGQRIMIELLQYIREEKKFPSIEALIKQIDEDKKEVLKYLQ